MDLRGEAAAVDVAAEENHLVVRPNHETCRGRESNMDGSVKMFLQNSAIPSSRGRLLYICVWSHIFSLSYLGNMSCKKEYFLSGIAHMGNGDS